MHWYSRSAHHLAGRAGKAHSLWKASWNNKQPCLSHPSRVAGQEEVLATKLDDPSLLLRTHVVEKNQVLKVAHALTSTHEQTLFL